MDRVYSNKFHHYVKQRGRRRIHFLHKNARGGRIIHWLLNDSFCTDAAAGTLDGREAEPGPGVMTVVDTGSNLSIADGNAVFGAGVGYGDPGIRYASTFTRAPGLLFFDNIHLQIESECHSVD